MRAECEPDDVRPEYDLSRAVRGRFAGQFTAEERESLLHASRVATARAWMDFAETRVHALEAAVFTYLVLGQHGPSTEDRAASLLNARSVVALPELLANLGTGPDVEGTLRRRFEKLASDTRWMACDPQNADSSPAVRLAHAERLEGIGREADALRELVSQWVAQRLERTGLSRQEIERKTEETAKLWLAA